MDETQDKITVDRYEFIAEDGQPTNHDQLAWLLCNICEIKINHGNQVEHNENDMPCEICGFFVDDN